MSDVTPLTDGGQRGDERHGDAEVDVGAEQQRPQVAVAAARARAQREQTQLVQRVPLEAQVRHRVRTLHVSNGYRETEASLVINL